MKVTKVRNKSVKIRKRKRSQKLHKTDKLLSKIVTESKMKLSWITLWKNKFWKTVKSMLSNEAISNKKKRFQWRKKRFSLTMMIMPKFWAASSPM